MNIHYYARTHTHSVQNYPRVFLKEKPWKLEESKCLFLIVN